MILPMSLFAFATTSPLVLLVLACLWGGSWIWAALATMTLASVLLDSLVPWVTSTDAAGDPDQTEFPAADLLLSVVGISVFIVLPLLVRVIAGPVPLALTARIALFLAGGLWFGQVAHPAAHELIHRPSRFLRGLGVAVYALLMFGHHASAHRLVHRRHVGTLFDPNSARAGEGFYRFLIRAWPQSLRAGLVAERAMRAGKRSTPYKIYGWIAFSGLGLGWVLAGLPGLLVWLGFGLHFGAQVFLSDYVQHYGLTRVKVAGTKGAGATGAGGSEAGLLEAGISLTEDDAVDVAADRAEVAAKLTERVEPVGHAHSWNTPHWFSSSLMLNAPRHSDHHVHPQRPFPALRLEEEAPLLPWPLPIACLVALFPPLWRRRMQPLLARQASLARQTR